MKVLVAIALTIGACCVGCGMLGGGGKSPPGLPTAYKPIKWYDSIRRTCGSGCKLLDIVAKNVASDGTMDLTSGALVRYEFKNLKRTTKSKSKSKDKNKYERVVITIPRVGSSTRIDKVIMDRATHSIDATHNRSRTVIGPKCELSKLWQLAMTKGADRKDLAEITYDRDGYLFEIEGKKLSLRFNRQCQLAWTPGKLVKPVQDYPNAASYAPEGAEFSELMAREVRSDGTADTSSDPAWVRYKFFWTQPLKPTEEVEVMLRGGGLKMSRKDIVQGSKPKGIPAPTCKFSELWKTALENKADKSKPARITYDSAGYAFRQESPLLSLKFDTSCKLKK